MQPPEPFPVPSRQENFDSPSPTAFAVDIAFPAEVALDSAPVPLSIQLAVTDVGGAAEPSQSVSISFSALAAPEILTLVLTAEGFQEISGTNNRTIEVYEDRDSQPAYFRLLPDEPGTWRIVIDLYHRGRLAGSTVLETRVVESGSVQSDRRAAIIQGETLQYLDISSYGLPDLELRVILGGGNRTLLYTLHSAREELGYNHYPVGAVQLDDEPRLFLERIYDRLNEMASEDVSHHTEKQHSDFKAELDRIGHDLYVQIFSEELKREYAGKIRKLREDGTIGNLLIISDEPWIPWELVKPYQTNIDSGEVLIDDDFLCAEFQLSRWLASGQGLRDSLIVSDARIVPTTGGKGFPLPLVDREIDYFGRRLPELLHRPSHTPLETVGEVLDALAGGAANLYHFSGHGHFDADNADQSALVLMGGEILAPSDLIGAVETGILQSKPLVFINTGSSGRIGFSIRKLGGWVLPFVSSGASAFIGANWAISDGPASEFAIAFYDMLWTGATLGETFHQARMHVRALYPDNLTWLAYVLYGNPTARVVLAEAKETDIAKTAAKQGIFRGTSDRLTILMLAASPKDMPRLRTDEEIRAIQKVLRKSKFRDLVELVPADAVRLSDLPSLLRHHQPQLIYFSGHGTTSQVVMLDDSGRGQLVTAEVIVDILSRANHRIHCVVFMASETEKLAEAAAEFVDCTIGVSGVITDQAALLFSSIFFEIVADGNVVKDAFTFASAGVGLITQDHSASFRLFARKYDPDQIWLLNEPATSDSPTAAKRKQEGFLKVSDQLAILLLSANPSDTSGISIAEETRAIEEATKDSPHSEKIRIVRADAIRASDLPGLIRDHQPQLVYFSGHATSDGLLMVGESGRSQLIPFLNIVHFFSAVGQGIRCVAFMATQTEKLAEAVAEFVDCTIGVSGEINDQDAILFSSGFFQAIAYGQTVGTAFQLALARLDLEGRDTRHSFRLFARKSDPDQILLLHHVPRDDEEGMKKISRSGVWLFMGEGRSEDQMRLLERADAATWAANSHTKTGDIVLMYRTAPYSDIAYLFRAASDAQPTERTPSWPWDNRIELVGKVALDSPVRLSALRDFPPLSDWSLAQNPQGAMRRRQDIRSDGYWEALRGLLVAHNPGLVATLATWEQLDQDTLLGEALSAVAVLEPEQLRAELLSGLALILAAEGGQYEQALSIAEAIRDDRARSRSVQAVAQALFQAGQPERAADALERALAAAEAIEDDGARSEALSQVAQALLQAGQPEQAAVVWERALAAAEDVRDDGGKWQALAKVAQALGVLAQASHPDRALALVEAIQVVSIRDFVLGRLIVDMLQANLADQALSFIQLAPFALNPALDAVQDLDDLASRRTAFEMLYTASASVSQPKPGTAGAGTRNRQALIIGVGSYEQPSWPPLPICRREAEAVFQTLVDPLYGGYPAQNVTLLLDPMVADVRQALADLVGRSEADDLVVVYFSGHGRHANDESPGALVLRDSELPAEELQAALAALPAHQSLVLLDTHDIGLRASHGTAVIISASGSEMATAGAHDQLGPFADHLIVGLKGQADRDADGSILVSEIFAYLAPRMTTDTEDRQHPALYMDEFFDFPVVERLKLTASTESALRWAEGWRQIVGGAEIYTEYVLAGLFQKRTATAYELLDATGDIETATAELEALANQMSGTALKFQQVTPAPRSSLSELPLSKRMKEALEHATFLSAEAGARAIRSRHLLAGILAVPTSVAAQFLSQTTNYALPLLQTLMAHLPEDRSLTAPWIIEFVRRKTTVEYAVALNLPDKPIRVGEDFIASVSLQPPSDDNGAAQSTITLPLDGLAGSELDLFLDCQALLVTGNNAGSLPLPEHDAAPGEPALEHRFVLSATRSGIIDVRVDVYFQGSLVTDLQSSVTVQGVTVKALESTARPRPVPQPDLVLQIRSVAGNDGTVSYVYRLDSYGEVAPAIAETEFASDRLPQTLTKRAWNILAATLASSDGALPEESRLRLASLSHRLYNTVIPAELRRVLGHLDGGNHRAISLLILSDAWARLPWSLLHNGRGFLSEQLVIGHWPLELKDNLPFEFPVGSVSVAYYDPISPDQADAWAGLLHPRGRADFASQVLAGGVVDLAHVGSLRGLHLIRQGSSPAEAGRFDAPVLVSAVAGRGHIAAEVRSAKLNLRRNRPLVSLSYLSAGRPEATHLEDTWAAAYLGAGCSAFVGPLWAVAPEVEAAFASGFYASLWQGNRLGDAFQAGRRLAQVSVPESIDWLSYALFGDPMARPYRPIASEGYAVVEPVGWDMEQPLAPGADARFRVMIRRAPPVWHTDRVIEVVEELQFDRLEVDIVADGFTIDPGDTIVMRRTPTGDYRGWFTLRAPNVIPSSPVRVQLYFMDGERMIHNLLFSITIA